MAAATARTVVQRALRLLLAACAAVGLVSCGAERRPPPEAPTRIVHDLAPVTYDDEPGPSAPTLEQLDAVEVLETHSNGDVVYRMKLGDKPLGTIRYYGFPVYPNGRGAELLSPARDESEPPDTGYVAALVTPDDPAEVSAWYQGKLRDWRLAELLTPSGDKVAASILYQPPRGRRRVCISPAGPDVGLTLVGYQVLEGGGTPPLPLDPKAYHKWEHVLSLGLALDQYRADTGESASSIGDLLATEGPAGYQGPYLAGEPPVDPYTGRPYEVKDGRVVGPGDIEGFTS